MSRLNRKKFNAQVVSMMELGPVGEKVRTLGVPVRSLGMQQGKPNPLALARLAQWLKRDKPDVLQTWMYHADLLGSLAAKLVGNIAISWNIRHSDLRPALTLGSSKNRLLFGIRAESSCGLRVCG